VSRARHLARTLALLLTLLATASGSRAAGVSLRWDRCFGDAGVQNRDFSCDTNAGADKLVGSFMLGVDVAHVEYIHVKVDLASAGSELPQWWWFFHPGTCRQLSLSIDSLPFVGAACTDWTSGQATSGIVNYVINSNGANTSELIMIRGPTTGTEDLVAGQEFYAFTVTINHLKTVGTGSCAGCLTPVCIVLSELSLVITGVHADDVVLSGPANGADSDWATWQGGGGVVVRGNSGCPAATPTAKRAWGALKSLYR
jgi:hypothetical protein